MIAWIVQAGDIAIPAPSGWNTLGTRVLMGSTTYAAHLYWRRFVTGDGGPTFTKDSADALLFCGYIGAWRGASTTDAPVVNTGLRTASSATVNTNDLTGVQSGDRLIFFAAAANDILVSSYNGTDPTFTERVDTNTTVGTDAALSYADADANLTGTQSGRTATLSAATSNVGFLVRLIPATVGLTVTPAQLGLASLFTPVIVPGLVSVSPALLGGASLLSPTKINLSLALSLLGGATIHSPVISQTGGALSVLPDRLGLAGLLSPTVQPGGISISPDRLGGAAVLVPTFRLYISPARLGMASLLAPSLARAFVLARLGGASLLSPIILGIATVGGKVISSHGLIYGASTSATVISDGSSYILVGGAEESHG
jgi:hypothetical protein